MRSSNEPLRAEVTSYLSMRFGVADSAFAGVSFDESGGGEIWVSAHVEALGLACRRPPGLRALRRSPSGLKPTSAFLVAIDPLVTSSRVEVDLAALRSLLLGRRVSCHGDDGYVALSFAGSVIGCGEARDGVLHCLIPTGRRRELLDTLDVPRNSGPAEV